jgi:selenocysteine lyase/cysteine desulfurase
VRWRAASRSRRSGPARQAQRTRYRAGLDQDPHGYLTENEVDNEIAVRAAAAEYLDVATGEVALTDSTTMGLGLLYGGLRPRADQEVLTTEHDFYSTHEALRLRSARTGSTVNQLRLYDSPADASVDEIVGRLLGAVTPRTRAVASPGFTPALVRSRRSRPSPTGCATLTQIARPRTAAAVRRRRPQARRRGCDGCRSGLRLPRGRHSQMAVRSPGTGIVWGRAEAWEAVDVAIAPFEPVSYIAWVEGTAPTGQEPGLAATPGGYHSFDHRWALAEAFRFHLDIGKAAIAERTHEQATMLKEGLTDERSVTVVSPMSPELSAGIVCVSVDAPQETLGRLSEAGISAGMTPYAEPYVRFGPSIVTSPEEVDAIIEAMSS